MNGVHDMGGMHGMGPLAPEADEPVFHADWEARVHALNLASPTRGNIDAGRHRVELIPPGDYLRMSYYERWLTRLEGLLLEGGFVSSAELASGRADAAATRGVDSVHASEHALDVARTLAGELGCVVAVTGAVYRLDRGNVAIADPNSIIASVRTCEPVAERYLADLRGEGRSVVTIERNDEEPRGAQIARQAAETIEAMRAGAEVIYQATFFDGRWLGYADFLLRVDEPASPSAWGAWHYEVADTKLARHVKAGAILQICSYVEQLTRLQGVQPTRLHVVLGGSAGGITVLRWRMCDQTVFTSLPEMYSRAM